MYNDPYAYIESTTQISLVQIFSVVAIILLALVLPIELIELQRNAPKEVYTEAAIASRQTTTNSAGGRVAGISTTQGDSVIVEVFGTSYNLGSESQLFTYAGIVLITLSASLGIYLFFYSKPEPQLDLE